jgi:hypothetical protein
MAQQGTKEYKAGHSFYISLPEYMSRVTYLNTAAAIQFIDTTRDIAGFVVMDTKEDLKLSGFNDNSITEFYKNFMKDFLKGQEGRTASSPTHIKLPDKNIIESDVSCYAKDVQSNTTHLYYLAGIVETKTSFYKVICFSSQANKNPYKPVFQSILYSLRD